MAKQAAEAAAAGRYRAAADLYAKQAQLVSGTARLKALLEQADATLNDKRPLEALALAVQVERLAPAGDPHLLGALLRQARWTRDSGSAERAAILEKLEAFAADRRFIDFIISEIEWHADKGRTAQAVALAAKHGSRATDSRQRAVLRKLHGQHLSRQAAALFRAPGPPVEPILAVGRSFEQAGSRDEALAHYAEAARRLPPNGAAEALRRRAALLAAAGDHGAAAHTYRQALLGGVGQPAAWHAEVELELARALERNRRPDEALGIYRSLANRADQPESARIAQLALARSALERDRLDEAASLLATPLLQDPGSRREVRELLAAIEKKRTPVAALPANGNLDAADKLLSTARRQLADEDARAARATLQRILTAGKGHPRFAAAAILTASCERALDRPQEAQRLLQGLDGMRLSLPEQIDAALVQAEIHFFDQDQPARAWEVLQRLVASAPAAGESAEVRLRGASILFALGRAEEARAALAPLATDPAVAESTPPTPADRLLAITEGANLARVPDPRVPLLMAAGKHREALRLLARHGPARAGDEASAWRQLQTARCHNAMGNHKKALEAYGPFTRELSGSRWADSALLRMAVLQIGPLNDSRAGRRTLETLLAKHPQGEFAPRALLYLATLDQWAGRKASARAHAQKLLQNYPGTQEALYVQNQLLPQLTSKS